MTFGGAGADLLTGNHDRTPDGCARQLLACYVWGGPHRTKHMRASFFTKYLYAADAPGDGSPGRALILDQLVAIALNDLHDWGLPEQSGWTPDTYQRWLERRDERRCLRRASTVV